MLTTGVEPKIMLEISNDGGFNYIPTQIWSTMGRIGARLSRCRWNKLGMSRDRVFRITITDPVKICMIDGRLDVTTEKV